MSANMVNVILLPTFHLQNMIIKMYTCNLPHTCTQIIHAPRSYMQHGSPLTALQNLIPLWWSQQVQTFSIRSASYTFFCYNIHVPGHSCILYPPSTCPSLTHPSLHLPHTSTHHTCALYLDEHRSALPLSSLSNHRPLTAGGGLGCHRVQ